ncbi:carbohydrate-binding protein [Nostoc punctiforme UO1]|uniref:carbohydrate-binding protein n=1 Tax=Nostoc punctiforme TaxID=272131 RepID=UPI0030B2AFC3
MININIQQFQGTSEVGDFQSALNDAINQALEALSVDTSDNSKQYKCLQEHDSVDPNWTPPNTPALWQPL